MSTTFADLGVPAPVLDALARRGIDAPFPIQAATIPDALAGRDLCGKAATGSGKTIAFGVPMVVRVQRAAPKRPKGLVLAPTRELAIQVADELHAIGGELRILAVYGGAGIEPQIKKLRAGADIVVATPGRLIDLIDRRVCDLRDVTFAVVDEADRMADMGFLPDVRKILDLTADDRQTVLFSATLDGAVDDLVHRYQHDPVVHEVADEPTGDVQHLLWPVDRHDRVQLVGEIVDRIGPTVVFCRTKHGSDRVATQLAKAGVSAAAIHGNRSQAQRERALNAFHDGKIQALVATDVAARGIHVEGVTGVVHFDLPQDPKDYVHRSGRTGRAGSDGTVIALVEPKQRKQGAKLLRAAGIEGVEATDPDVAALPEAPQRRFRPAARRKGHDAERPGKGSKPSGAKRSSTPERSSRSDRSPSPKGQHRSGDAKRSPDAKRPGDAKRSGDDKRLGDAKRSGTSVAGRSERSKGYDAPRWERDDRADRGERRGPTTARNRRPGKAERAQRRFDADHEPVREARWEDRRDDRPRKGKGPNRAERRAAQFTDAERAERAARNEARERRGTERGRKGADARGRSTPTTGKGHVRRAEDHTLPADVAGAAKIRPSGAARRKARREELRASGELTAPPKQARSGKPRPPARSKAR